MNEMTTVKCTSCSKEAAVPFVPTPGRPVYCRACFEKRNAPGSSPRGRMTRPAPRRRMMSQKRKRHFVYDAMIKLEKEPELTEDQRRTFVEMLFARGSRQGTDAAQEFLREKREDETISEGTASEIEGLVESYSGYR